MQEKKYHYQISDWLYDPIASQLVQGNKKINLQNQVAKVLLELICTNGQLISKKQLLQRAWEGTVVTENSLDKTISELRKVFGDSRTNPMFIETIPKKGYRIIAPIKKVEIESREILTLKKSKNPKWALLLLIPILVILIYLFKTNPTRKKALSPNGQLIASMENMGSYYKLSVEEIANGATQLLDSFARPESMVLNWSSDSKNIIYNTTQEENKFYAINVFNLNTQSKSYIKFPRADSISMPDNFPSGTTPEFVQHEKLSHNSNTVQYIAYDKNDTIKVLFDDKLISDFKW